MVAAVPAIIPDPTAVNKMIFPLSKLLIADIVPNKASHKNTMDKMTRTQSRRYAFIIFFSIKAPFSMLPRSWSVAAQVQNRKRKKHRHRPTDLSGSLCAKFRAVLVFQLRPNHESQPRRENGPQPESCLKVPIFDSLGARDLCAMDCPGRLPSVT